MHRSYTTYNWYYIPLMLCILYIHIDMPTYVSYEYNKSTDLSCLNASCQAFLVRPLQHAQSCAPGLGRWGGAAYPYPKPCPPDSPLAEAPATFQPPVAWYWAAWHRSPARAGKQTIMYMQSNHTFYLDDRGWGSCPSYVLWRKWLSIHATTTRSRPCQSIIWSDSEKVVESHTTIVQQFIGLPQPMLSISSWCVLT